MPQVISDAASAFRVTVTGTVVLTTGLANIVGIAFHGTGTGGIQFFAGVTASASITPMITFCATSSAVAGGFSPMFLRFPLAVSGTGCTLKSLDSLDTNLTIFWSPMGTTF